MMEIWGREDHENCPRVMRAENIGNELRGDLYSIAVF